MAALTQINASGNNAHREGATVQVLLPLAIDGPYTYGCGDIQNLEAGDIVEVPLGNRMIMGVVWDEDEGAAQNVSAAKLRNVAVRMDTLPIPLATRQLVDWIADYTLSSPGMVLRGVLRTQAALHERPAVLGVRYAGGEPARMTPARARVLAETENGLAWPKRALVEAAGVSTSVIDGLVDQGVLESVALKPAKLFEDPDPDFAVPELSAHQREAADQILASIRADAFSVTYLDGVTGSGKTEVYFEALAETLRRGKQALVLLPEIALTNQFLERFEARFGVRPAEWHSALTPRAREDTWRGIHRGEIRIIVGARSALLLPFAQLGLIVVDEEHDPAYKQEDRVTYHARDMAVVRGHLSAFPVILSTATPSLETWINARSGKYKTATLPARFGAHGFPDVGVIDLRSDEPERGRWLAPQLVEAVRNTLEQKGQALLFLNRRGYAPLTLCRKCGHRFQCPQCTAWLVEHRFRGSLACHHCGFSLRMPSACPHCDAEDSLVACGPGVERIAEEAMELFEDASMTILSSDLTGGVVQMRQRFSDIADGRYNLIIGTQLIAKGHHFPNLELIGVVDGDLGLGHGDLRAAERTYQLLHQVVGRAGRGKNPGRGLIQSHMPDHPVLQALISGDREAFYESEAHAREREGLPPFGRLAALIISGRDKLRASAYARHLAQTAPQMKNVRVLGPAEAPIALVRGRHRFRLLIKTQRNTDIQSFLRAWLAHAGDPKGGVRLSVDVDPQSFY